MSKLKKQPIHGFLGEIIGYDCPCKQVKILVCEKSEADAIIEKHHYSKKPTKNSFLSMLVLHYGAVSGALQIGYGIRPKIKGADDPESVREFDRMWLSDTMPKYSETIVLSMLHKYLKQAHPNIKKLISYSDTSVGNNGTIYRAGNYKEIGRIKADFYILANGERVHPVSMWHRHGSRAFGLLQSIYPQIKKADGMQLKFEYLL